MRSLVFTRETAAEYRAALRTMKDNWKAVVDCYQETSEGTPAETVKVLVDRLGYDTAVMTVAEIVNSIGKWDARVYGSVHAWAESIDAAATKAELDEKHFYQPCELHSVHVNQIALAMMAYAPEEAEEETDGVTEAEVAIAVDDLSESELVEAHNALCEANNDPDGTIYSMDDFSEFMSGTSPLDLALMIHYGQFNPRDDWFSFDGYGNLRSYSYAQPLQARVSRSEIIEGYLADPDAFRDTALGEALTR